MTGVGYRNDDCHTGDGSLIQFNRGSQQANLIVSSTADDAVFTDSLASVRILSISNFERTVSIDWVLLHFRFLVPSAALLHSNNSYHDKCVQTVSLTAVHDSDSSIQHRTLENGIVAVA